MLLKKEVGNGILGKVKFALCNIKHHECRNHNVEYKIYSLPICWSNYSVNIYNLLTSTLATIIDLH